MPATIKITMPIATIAFLGRYLNAEFLRSNYSMAAFSVSEEAIYWSLASPIPVE